MPSARTHRHLRITDTTSTRRPPGEHRQATHTSIRHICTPQPHSAKTWTQQAVALAPGVPGPPASLAPSLHFLCGCSWGSESMRPCEGGVGVLRGRPRLVLRSSLQTQRAALTAQSRSSAGGGERGGGGVEQAWPQLLPDCLLQTCGLGVLETRAFLSALSPRPSSPGKGRAWARLCRAWQGAAFMAFPLQLGTKADSCVLLEQSGPTL